MKKQDLFQWTSAFFQNSVAKSQRLHLRQVNEGEAEIVLTTFMQLL